jgi:hypothetical protein
MTNEELQKENTYLRGQLQSVKCPYGHKNADGVCSQGIPGCSCADDLWAANDEIGRDVLNRLAATAAEVCRLRAALELIAAPMRADGTYNRDRSACGIVAREALKAPNDKLRDDAT